MKQSKRVIDVSIIKASLLAATVGCLFALSARPTPANPPAGYNEVWSDEFNGSVGSPPNSANWSYDLGGGGWGNNELETYTSNTSNASIVADGAAPNGRALYITATQSGGNYYSARIRTQGKQQFTYGYFEASISHPSGSGLWPAWWMLGAVNNGWPNEGEIDIFEQFEANPTNEFSSFWFGTNGLQGWSNNISVAQNGYQTYGILWTPTTTQEYYNGQGYGSHGNPGSPFNAPFYFLINLAVGGNPGGVGGNTSFPSSLKMGYVRVYEPGGSSSSSTSGTSGSSGGSIANGTYSMAPGCATGSRLDVPSANYVNGQTLQIWQANGTGAQSWTFANVGGNNYNMAVGGPFCLDSAGSTTPGNSATIWTCNGNPNQSWTATGVSGGYTFKDGNAGLCLDVWAAGNANGTKVDTYTCNGTNAQTWSLH